MQYHLRRVLVVLVVCLLLAGCAPASLDWASISGWTIESDSAGEDFVFDINVDQAMIDEGKPVKLYASGTVRSGELQVELVDPQGQAIWNPRFASQFNADGQYVLDQVGTYRLGASWDGPVSAVLNLSWNAITLTPAMLVPGIGMIAVAVGFIVYSLRRKSGWKYMLLGAALWAVTVAVKFVIAALLNPHVYRALFREDNLWAPGSILFYLYIGALTGITEVLLTWLLLRYTRLGQAVWAQVLGFGLGFGAFEALLLGVMSFTGSMLALVSPGLVATAMGSYAATNNVLYGLGPVAERFAVILVHLLCNVLLFYGAWKREARWFWAAFVIKSLMDAVAGFAQMWGVETVAKLWAVESVILVFGAVAWAGTLRLRQRYTGGPTTGPAELNSQAV